MSENKRSLRNIGRARLIRLRIRERLFGDNEAEHRDQKFRRLFDRNVQIHQREFEFPGRRNILAVFQNPPQFVVSLSKFFVSLLARSSSGRVVIEQS